MVKYKKSCLETVMKGVFLFGSKLRVYLTELPVLILLALVISHNQYAENLLKFYPLIILLSAAAIFIAVYFFRGVYITREQVKEIGLFSGREREVIKKASTVVITLRKRGRMNLDLWEYSSEPAFDWMKKDDDVTKDVRVFHSVVIGRRRSAERVLRYFGVDSSVAENIFSDATAVYEDQSIRVHSEENHDTREIHIKVLTDELFEEL